jgi:aldehyde dehydrogenase (NAD+)
VIVLAAVYDQFMELLLKETKTMLVGPGTDPSTKVCPVINERQFNSIMKAIEDAKTAGAKCIVGGQSLTKGRYSKGWYIEPTIFTDVDPQSFLAQEEIFGPVLAVFKVDGFEEAMTLANNVRYGLTASIFTRDVNRAMVALERFEAGCCYVNAPTYGSEPHMPFGGWKASGIGAREPGLQAMDVFSEWKTIYVDFSGGVQQSQYKMK